ncbi:MAG TPA: hypothetical protein VFE05_13220 [Longimicrobiaceae bacterium]|jgi:hypothetical protein|nr:hypothetical protein [Longimicrobiaceae bacterium]
MRTKTLLAALAIAAAAHAAPARSQAPPRDTVAVYRREVFSYDPRGRPDPFRPLLSPVDLGIKLEDLHLTGVLYNPDPRYSMAVFAQTDSTAPPLRLHRGQRYGNLTVVAIYPRRVDVRVDQFGQSRVESIILRTRPTAQAVQPAGPQAQQPVVVQMVPQSQPQQPVRQRRSDRPVAPPAANPAATKGYPQ